MLLTFLTSFIFGGLVGGAAGAVLGAVVDWFIDDESLGDYIKEEYDDAFKLLIQEKKKNAVQVGIFDVCEDEIETVEIQSESGVSNSIYKGQVIYV